MNQEARDLYMHGILPQSHPGSQYLLMGLENELGPEELERRFAEHINIETVARKTEAVFSREIAVYLMTRRGC